MILYRLLLLPNSQLGTRVKEEALLVQCVIHFSYFTQWVAGVMSLSTV